MPEFFIVNEAGYNAELILTQANNITNDNVLIHEDFQGFQVKIFQKRSKQTIKIFNWHVSNEQFDLNFLSL